MLSVPNPDDIVGDSVLDRFANPRTDFSELGRIRARDGISVETFARSGALSISDGAPRGAALAAVFVRVGLGGHISTKSAQTGTLPAAVPVQVLLISALA
jgi:hypothetical protein